MDKLKIVIISDWFSDKMGYAENFLPKALAALGHDVHLVTSTAQVYYNSSAYDETYQPFLGPRIVPAGISHPDAYILHRLPLTSNRTGVLIIKGLIRYLNILKPQIIQTFSINSLSTYQAAKYCHKNDCKLFTESHLHASVFNAPAADKTSIFKKNILKIIFKKNILKFFLEKFRSRLNPDKLKFIDDITQICYPIAPDAAKIAVAHFGTSPRKIKIQSLGVDTDLFHPAPDLFVKEERDKFREQLGLNKDSLVGIYTGRFTRDKKPQCLAQAVDYLQDQGANIQALFIGNGTAEEIKEISARRGCIVHEFVPVAELPKFYWAADIGVWPSQESTSQLDAAAAGLPLILSNRIEVKERVDGNGLLYEEDDATNLAEKIGLLKDVQLRQKMSSVGAAKVRNKFSWRAIAQARSADYYQALLK
jgi:glycosyltransferase involved in cell wall biosynthesis